MSEDRESKEDKGWLARFVSSHEGPLGALAIYVCAAPVAVLATMHHESHREEARNAANKRSNLFVEAMAVADSSVDGDGVMGNKEWSKIYSSAGLVYSPRFSDPRSDLTNDQLRSYLDMDE